MDFQKELIAEYDREVAKTRKMLEAIPADVDFTYKPHPKSMVLGRFIDNVQRHGLKSRCQLVFECFANQS